MNCFKHNDRVAVGICKSCGKGVCSACAIPRKNGLACEGECEERVDLLNRIVDNNAKTLAAARYQTRSSGMLSIAAGLVFLGFGLAWSFIDGLGPSAALCTALGLVMIVTGIVRLNRKSAYPQPEK